MIKIINENDREKEVKDMFIMQQDTTATIPTEDGKTINKIIKKDFVEMTVIGRRADYKYWMELEIFNTKNPEIKI